MKNNKMAQNTIFSSLKSTLVVSYLLVDLKAFLWLGKLSKVVFSVRSIRIMLKHGQSLL